MSSDPLGHPSQEEDNAPRPRALALATLFARWTLAAGFLSAVADRFGLWGPAGTPGVIWGSFNPFLEYTGQLFWYLPSGLVSVLGWAATVAEVILAIGLIVGIRLHEVAFGSGVLLTLFAIAMTTAFGVETPLSYSVWSAAAAAFLLASLHRSSALD